jgi:hypothetical protein
MTRYFSRFPLVDYGGTPAKNILARVDFTEQTKKDIYSNFDFVLQEGASRPDILSFNYYGTTQYDWLVYLSNNIVDPYHDYYLSELDFKNYIIGKYGSTENARSKILYYRNNWAPDESLISETVYDGLQPNIKKYWKPKLSLTDQIIGYERVKTDWIVSTNRVVELVVSFDISSYNVGDEVFQDSTDALGILVNKNDDTNVLTLHHITGAFAVSPVEGVLTVTILKENIPITENAFWAPVYAYDHEEEQNELKRYITLIKAGYVPDIEKTFIEQLKK